MGAVNSSQSYKFRPDDYSTPDVKPGKDGKYHLTDYQAALTIRSWMHKNMMPGEMMDSKMTNEALHGSITVNGKSIQLNQQERAAFNKLTKDNAALFYRLDSGENGTHDLRFGTWDIDAAIRNGRLHGSAKSSPEGHWRNRNDDVPPAQAGKELDDFFSGKMGSNWVLTKEDLRRLASAHLFFDKDSKTYKPIDNPEVVRAAGVLLDNWGEIQIGEGNSVGTLSREELQKLMSL